MIAAVGPGKVDDGAGRVAGLGGDYAGVVVSGGDYAGQQVWGSGPALGMALGAKRPGTHARYVALPGTWLSRKPERLTMAQAGAVGRSYFVAWQTVINGMELMPGETILITGLALTSGSAAKNARQNWRFASRPSAKNNVSWLT